MHTGRMAWMAKVTLVAWSPSEFMSTAYGVEAGAQNYCDGPSPYWKISLPHNIVETWRNRFNKPPLRMGEGNLV